MNHDRDRLFQSISSNGSDSNVSIKLDIAIKLLSGLLSNPDYYKTHSRQELIDISLDLSSKLLFEYNRTN